MAGLAAFDFDGTLIRGNSLFEAVRQKRKTRFLDCFAVKALDAIIPVRKALYERAFRALYPDGECSYAPLFRSSAVELLNRCLKSDFKAVILSSAPDSILLAASNRLGVPYIRCKPGRKQEALDELGPYDSLLVCTDNKNDIRLLMLADYRLVYATGAKAAFFRRRLQRVCIIEE